MANRDEVKGLQPYGPLLRAQPYTTGGTIYEGDPVKPNGSGVIVVATAGDACIGVALSYGVSGDTIMVADHPDQLFVCQQDSTDIDAATDMHLNYNFTFGTASTLFRRSGVEIDSDTGATNSNKQAKVLRFLPAVDNDTASGNSKVICKINNHILGQGTGTLGV